MRVPSGAVARGPARRPEDGPAERGAGAAERKAAPLHGGEHLAEPERGRAAGQLYVEWAPHPELEPSGEAVCVPSWARQPLRFGWGSRMRRAVEVLDRWPGEHACDFRVRGDDGATYILRYLEREQRWELVFFRA